jgi:hypothetical protein
LQALVADLRRVVVGLDEIAAWLTANGFRLEHVDDPEGGAPAGLVPFFIHRLAGASESVRDAAGVIAPFAAPEETHSSIARLRLR